MAPPTYRGQSTTRTSSSLSIGVPGAATGPVDGCLLLAIWRDSSVGGTEVTAAGAGWTLAGADRSPPEGRRSQIAVAYRIWREGDPTTVTPFTPPTSHNNREVSVIILEGADTVSVEFNRGVGGTASTGALSLPGSVEAYVHAMDLYPRSMPGHAPFPDISSWSDPPFDNPAVSAGTGFNNMFGYSDAAFLAGASFGPYFTTTYDGSWVTALAAAYVAPLGPARVRSSVSEDAGSLFQATQATAVELGVSEAFEYGVNAAGAMSFREALTPEQVALRYHSVPTRNQEMLTTVEGETNLGRLAHTIAPRIFTRGASIPGNVGGVVTAQQAVQYVVNVWASEHPWLVFEPVPDLRLLLPDALRDPRQYYLDHPTAGVLTTSNVVIEQEGNDRRTMREVLDEWLAIFPGTIVRQTSSGTIEIVPRVGPDAPDGPSLELAWRDLARISDGEDDPRGVYNRARVTSQGWEWVENQALIPPTYTVFTGPNSMDPQLLEDNDVLPDTEPLSPWVERRWEAFTEPGALIEFTVEVRAYGALDSPTTPSSFLLDHFESYTFSLRPGQSHNIRGSYRVLSVGGIGGTLVTYRFQIRTSDDGVQVLAPDGFPGYATAFGRTVWLAHVVDIVAADGTAWTRSNREIEGEFGQEGTTLPGVGGGDAIQQSRAQYGERRAEIRSSIFQLDNLQAEAVARSYVAFNINPRTIREVQQSEWDRYPVKFDHIGRLVELPNGEVAVVENRSYSDSFAPRASAMLSTFTATVSHSVIDTTTEFMFLDSGDYAQLDDDTLIEAS